MSQLSPPQVCKLRSFSRARDQIVDDNSVARRLPGTAAGTKAGVDCSKMSGTLPSSTVKDARKKRRVTIITISDSEDDENAPPLPSRRRSLSKTPSLVIEDHSGEQDDLAEDVSFADYSDDDASEAEAVARKAPTTGQVIEIDSSDSEYDAGAGVITW